ncbi:fat-like cadherin-related tumor suppressor homolog [Saccostrea echinata]|uniref:fat-like cadherin-related tumor suppressor homolog n=1 Tax=Saccostrea echinata TaxID=191078 RepID=UPI002A80CC67|nr:fat-like cadherin-related tumor suppressor homolog [Saccostrea echinata]
MKLAWGGCGPSQSDIIFVTDESGSVGSYNFQLTLEALRDTVALLDIDSGNVRVGVMCFQSSQRTIFHLNAYNSISSMQTAIMNIDYKAGGTKIGSAMKFTRENMFLSSKGDRAGATNIMVVLTDGVSNDNERAEAALVKAAGIVIISVGIGNNLDVPMLIDIAHDPSHYLQTEYSQLAATLSAFVQSKVPCPWYCDTGSGFERGGDLSKTSSLNSNSGVTYILEDTSSSISCCGAVESWSLYPKRSGSIYLQIWRPLSGSTYKLVGYNYLYIHSGNINRIVKYIVPDNERITVNDGDKIGWYSSGQEMIPYTSAGSNNQRRFSWGTTTVGTTKSVSSYSNINAQFAIKLNLENDTSDLWFVNSGRTIHLYDNASPGTQVYTVVNGQRSQDILTRYMSDPSGRFTWNSNTGIVSTTSSLVNGQTYVMTFTAKKTCLNTTISGGSLSVKVSNTPPRITSLPAVMTLSENQESSKTLHVLTVADGTDSTVTCSIVSVDPSSATSLFSLNRASPMSYNLVLNSNPGFDYDTIKKYTITLSCTDGKNSPVYGYFKLFLQRNVRPALSNIPANGYSYSASSRSNMTDFITLTATDPDNSDFTYAFEYCGPYSCPVWMLDDSSGLVEYNQSMGGWWKGGFNVGFSVTDGKTKSKTKYIPVHLTGYRYSPSFISLPTQNNIIINEKIPTNQYLFTVTYYDLDVNALSVTFTISNGDWTYFTIKDNTDVYTSNTQIDFESLSRTNYYIQARVNDGTSTVSRGFWVYIRDINEAPTFQTTVYTVTADEGPAGTQLTPYPPAYVFTDIDATDSHFFTLDCGANTRYLSFDTTNGAVSFGRAVDVDNGAPRMMSCKVKVYDKGYLSDTADLYVTIYDTNDNAPRFDKQYYTYSISPGITPGTVVGLITLTDADLTAPHNSIGRVWFENQPTDSNGQNYFSYDNITKEFTVAQNLSQYFFGSYLEFQLKALDLGSPPLEATANIVILFEPTTTTIAVTTTETPGSFGGDAKNTLWMTAVGMGGVAMLATGGYVAFKAFSSASGFSPTGSGPINVSSAPQTSDPAVPDDQSRQKKPKKAKSKGRDKVFKDSNMV